MSKIKVIVDGDAGIVLSECIRISRHIEHNLDREEEDFSLEVTSPTATDPIVIKRQYNKNINRTLKVDSLGGKFEGKLIKLGENSITLHWKSREPKPIGKGKVTVVKEQIVPFDEINQAVVKITF